MDAAAKIAVPAPGTSYRLADCKHCAQPIYDQGDGWMHTSTGEIECKARVSRV